MLDLGRPDADLKADVGRTAPYSRASEILSVNGFEDVDLSVRASNCLKNGDIKYLGELSSVPSRRLAAPSKFWTKVAR